MRLASLAPVWILPLIVLAAPAPISRDIVAPLSKRGSGSLISGTQTLRDSLEGSGGDTEEALRVSPTIDRLLKSNGGDLNEAIPKSPTTKGLFKHSGDESPRSSYEPGSHSNSPVSRWRSPLRQEQVLRDTRDEAIRDQPEEVGIPPPKALPAVKLTKVEKAIKEYNDLGDKGDLNDDWRHALATVYEAAKSGDVTAQKEFPQLAKSHWVPKIETNTNDRSLARHLEEVRAKYNSGDGGS
ncbi:hypothetical protein FRB96_008399 [Tulasnella sp. 330]|nr:hypothetical protein FRB96_008399 [Tulasnella sp. 330]KAG8880467.1 hypothetical protein FRB97_000768 [Tulasnella sp. 331]KAG8886939.1 hypothetical protein FRB98_000767 [Tulasnella sp. 332]